MVPMAARRKSFNPNGGLGKMARKVLTKPHGTSGVWKERERETGEFNPLSLPRSQTLDCGPFGRRSDVASADSARSRFFHFKQFWTISPILVKSSRFALSRDIVEEFL